MDKPIFGEKKQFADYQTRYAAYIVIERDQQIAVIEAPNGAFFLPGGEIEGEETKEEAIVRELIEEMGIVAEISSYLGEADEYFTRIIVQLIIIIQDISLLLILGSV